MPFLVSFDFLDFLDGGGANEISDSSVKSSALSALLLFRLLGTFDADFDNFDDLDLLDEDDFLVDCDFLDELAVFFVCFLPLVFLGVTDSASLTASRVRAMIRLDLLGVCGLSPLVFLVDDLPRLRDFDVEGDRGDSVLTDAILF